MEAGKGTTMKKVAILTLKGYFNYGNRLQKYALTKVLHDMGHDVYSIWNKQRSDKIKESIIPFLAFIKKYEKLSKFYKISKAYSKDISTGDIGKLGMDTVVVGSDQVWNS